MLPDISSLTEEQNKNFSAAKESFFRQHGCEFDDKSAGFFETEDGGLIAIAPLLKPSRGELQILGYSPVNTNDSWVAPTVFCLALDLNLRHSGLATTLVAPKLEAESIKSQRTLDLGTSDITSIFLKFTDSGLMQIDDF